jgi:hypothetical protein
MRVPKRPEDCTMTLVDVTTKFFNVIMAHPECRHDLIMSLIYLAAVPVVIYWHRQVWVIYVMAFIADVMSALEAAGAF